MGRRILIVPDKFKGSLTALQAAEAIASGWGKWRPGDELDLLPMTDGGDGFGEVVGGLLVAKSRIINTVDAAHRPVRAQWWWEGESRTALIESARVIGLALLPWHVFHPFQLDTFGLAKALKNATRAGAMKCLVGIGGSATNDGGFGLARGLGWRFFDARGSELLEWWQLIDLTRVLSPTATAGRGVTVAVDVFNPLLGASGCTRVYGPQKGLGGGDFEHAEKCLRRMSVVLRDEHGLDAAQIPGAGAAGGLGFGLMAFAGARVKSGFDIFAELARLESRIRRADLVITGEGALDLQTHMGKGVGQIARWAARFGVPCLGLAGSIEPSMRRKGMFAELRELTEIAPIEQAKKEAARCLRQLAGETARSWAATVFE